MVQTNFKAWQVSKKKCFLYCNYQFRVDVPFIYPLETSENFWFSDVFRGYRNGTLAWNGLRLGIKGWTTFNTILVVDLDAVVMFLSFTLNMYVSTEMFADSQHVFTCDGSKTVEFQQKKYFGKTNFVQR